MTDPIHRESDRIRECDGGRTPGRTAAGWTGERVSGHWLLAGILIASVAFGCAGPKATPNAVREEARPPAANSTADLANAPEWVTGGCRRHWQDEEERRGMVCGVGSAPAARNRVAARDTAVARARTAVARSIQVTIENVVRLEDSGRNGDQGDLKQIVHQLSSASLPASEVISVWRADSGTVHALVALKVGNVTRNVRASRSFPPKQREAIAKRAEAAFADLDQAFEDY